VIDTEGAAWERDEERQRERQSIDSERYMSKTLPKTDATLPEMEEMPGQTTPQPCDNKE
jgi:hypothetical protein